MKLILSFILLTNFLFSQTVIGDWDFESAPSGGTFTDGSSRTISANLSSGATMTHGTSVGFDGSNCAKFNMSTVAWGFYAGFTKSLSGSQVNIRFLMKWNSGWLSGNGSDGKFMMVSKAGGDGERSWIEWQEPCAILGAYRQFMIAAQNTSYKEWHGNGQNPTSCGYVAVAHVDAANPIQLSNYTGTWVCIELEVNNSGDYNLYVSTDDSVFTDRYIGSERGATSNITGIITSFFEDCSYSASDYYLIDELRVETGRSADDPIGVPSGFYDVEEPPVQEETTIIYQTWSDD